MGRGQEFEKGVRLVGGVTDEFDTKKFLAPKTGDTSGLQSISQGLARDRRSMVNPEVQAQMAAQQDARDRQLGLTNMLGGLASGQQTGAGALMLQQARDRNINQARSMAASQQGASPGMALRSAQRAASDANLQTDQQAAIQSAIEQQQAQQALGGVLSNVRNQDLGASELGLRGDLANQSAWFQNQDQRFGQSMDANRFGLEASQVQFGQEMAASQYAREQEEFDTNRKLALLSQYYGLNPGQSIGDKVAGGLIQGGAAAVGGFLGTKAGS